MRLHFGYAIATVVLILASSRAEAAATGVDPGYCKPTTEPQLENLSTIVDRARDLSHSDPAAALRELAEMTELAAMNADGKKHGPPCIPADDARREISEQVELSRITKDVKAAADQQCKVTVCLSNLTHFVTGYNKNPWTFGGCENWSRLSAETIGARSYYTMRREQRCHLIVHCHWVVVLENARTGDVHMIDAWAYAGGWAPGSSQSWYLTGDYDKFAKKYGAVTDTEMHGKPRCP